MDLRKERTLTLLSSSLLGLLREKPYSQISVSEICERAMVRRATFYRHFADKEELLTYLFRQQRALIQERTMGEALDVPLAEYCQVMTRRLVGLISANWPLLQLHRQDRAFETVVEVLVVELAQEFARRIVQTASAARAANVGGSQDCGNDDVDVLAHFYASGLLGAVRWWVTEDPDHDEERLMGTFSAITERLFPSFPTDDVADASTDGSSSAHE